MISYQIAVQLAAANTDSLQHLQDRVLGLITTVITQIALPIGSGLIVIAIILAGLRYIQGDAKGGKTALVAAITGLAIVILSYIIIYNVVVPAIDGTSSTSTSITYQT